MQDGIVVRTSPEVKRPRTGFYSKEVGSERVRQLGDIKYGTPSACDAFVLT